MLSWYQAKVARRPLLTQAITTAVLFGAGDTLAQQAVERKGLRNHDAARTGRMVLYGGLIFGPAATKWYQFLQKRINLQSHNATIAARVVADQTIFSTCNLALFLSSMSYLEGTDPKKKLEKSYWPGLKANWALWPAVQAVNFKFVPLDQRVLVVNIVSLGWNCFLSWLNSSK